MRMRLSTILAAVLATAMASPALAGRIEVRHENQRAGIRQGVRAGSLTRGETIRLARQQVRIDRAALRFRADGRFTARERARVRNRQHLASRHIHRARRSDRRSHRQLAFPARLLLRRRPSAPASVPSADVRPPVAVIRDALRSVGRP